MPGPDAPRADEQAIYRGYLDAVGIHGLTGAGAAGLHPTEWYALAELSLSGRLTAGDLATRVGLTTGAATRLIDRLERAGRVRRLADPADRRRVIVEPVHDPHPDVETIVGPARRLVGEVLAGYTPEQRAVLFDYFARATPAFRRATAEIRHVSALASADTRH